MDAAVMRFVGVRRRTIFGALVLEAALVAVLGSAPRRRARLPRRRRHQRLLPAVLRHRADLLPHHPANRALQRRALAGARARGRRARGLAAGAHPADGALGPGMTGLGWGLRSLRRRPLRTALSLAGIAVAAAMLLDMVMLSGGIDKSFSELLLARGYQIRLTPKGTLPFDTEASIRGRLRPSSRAIRAAPGVEAAGAVLGTSLYGRTRPTRSSRCSATASSPRPRRIYQVIAAPDLAPGDTLGRAAERGRRRAASSRAVGDTRDARRAARPADRRARRWAAGWSCAAWCAGSTTTAASPRSARCCRSCSGSAGRRPRTAPRFSWSRPRMTRRCPTLADAAAGAVSRARGQQRRRPGGRRPSSGWSTSRSSPTSSAA